MNFKPLGTGVALVTPFHKYGTIDFGSLEILIEHIITNKVDYIVVLGTTGEAATLSRDERIALVNFVVETVNNRVPIVMGLGGNNTQEIINSLHTFSFDGISAVLSVAPYYNKPNQKGLYYHYKNVAGSCPVPVILYNVPGRTSCNISAETCLRLAQESDNIIAVKEASGNLEQCMEILKNKADGFELISGDDALTLPLLAMGAKGVISVVANAFPAEFSEMVSYGMKGDLDNARKIHYSLLDIMNTLFADGNPAGIKAALEVLGLISNNLRLPLVKVNKSVYHQIKTLIGAYNSVYA